MERGLYLANGNLSSKTEGDDLIQERVSDGTTYGYLPGPGIDRPLVRTNGSVAEFYLADHLGSIVQMTNTALSGKRDSYTRKR